MDRQTAIQTNVFSLIAGCGDLWVVSGTRAGFIIWLHLARLIACLQLKGFNKQTAIGLMSERRGTFLRQSITCLEAVASASVQEIQAWLLDKKNRCKRLKEIRSKLRILIPKLASHYGYNCGAGANGKRNCW